MESTRKIACIGRLVHIVFEHSLKHMHGALIGTRMFTQNLPTSIFCGNEFACTSKVNTSEITSIACVRITTGNFLSSLIDHLHASPNEFISKLIAVMSWLDAVVACTNVLYPMEN